MTDFFGNRLIKGSLIFLSLVLSACVSNQKLSYLNGQKSIADHLPQEAYLIAPHDLLYITVHSHSEEVNRYFGLSDAQSPANYQNLEQSPSLYLKSYSIDEEGNVNLPVIGKLSVAGKTLAATEKSIQTKVDAYFHGKHQVIVKLANNSFTLLGEVNKQGKFYLHQNELNILEAIGMGMGLTTYADHQNIKVIRKQEGQTHTYSINLNKQNPNEFIIHPNDIIYVSPLAKGAQMQLKNPTVSVVLSGFSTLLIMISLLVR